MSPLLHLWDIDFLQIQNTWTHIGSVPPATRDEKDRKNLFKQNYFLN